MTTATIDPTRRDVLKATGAATTAVVVASVTNTTVRRVAATDSDEIELTTDATIPEEAAIQVTVDEFESEGDSDPTNSETIEIDDGENTYELEDLDGGEEYDFEIELGTDDESPEIESLLLELPEDVADEIADDDDEEDEDDETDTEERCDGIHVSALGWCLFGDWVEEEVDEDEDDDDDGWFSFDFDFWPFNR